MDAAGWVAVEDVLRALSMTEDELEEVVAKNNKSRLERVGERIRACQGHSREGMPVTLEALEASWQAIMGDDEIWHGTKLDALEGIAKEGILPGARTHVHLAEEVDSKVGKRAQVAVMLKVSVSRLREQGFIVYKSPNGVVLVRQVPVDCIVDLKAMTEKARREEARLREMFWGKGG